MSGAVTTGVGLLPVAGAPTPASGSTSVLPVKSAGPALSYAEPAGAFDQHDALDALNDGCRSRICKPAQR